MLYTDRCHFCTRGQFCMRTLLHGDVFARMVTFSRVDNFARQNFCTQGYFCANTLLHKLKKVLFFINYFFFAITFTSKSYCNPRSEIIFFLFRFLLIFFLIFCLVVFLYITFISYIKTSLFYHYFPYLALSLTHGQYSVIFFHFFDFLFVGFIYFF